MILSANGIMSAIKDKRLGIKDFKMEQLNPNSYDLTLGNKIAFYALYTEDSSHISYGQLDEYRSPDMFGHECALPPIDGQPGVTVVVNNRPLMDPAKYMNMIQQDIPDIGIILYPGNVYLAMVNEVFEATEIIPEVRAKSSIARAGIRVINSDGYANLGDTVRFVLEITVMYPTILYPNMKIAQAYFHETDKDYVPGMIKYNGRYVNAANAKTPDGEDLISGYVPDPALKVKIDEIRKEYAEEERKEQEAYEAQRAAEEAAKVTEENAEVSNDKIIDMPTTAESVPAVEQIPIEGNQINGFDIHPISEEVESVPENPYGPDEIVESASKMANEPVNLIPNTPSSGNDGSPE